MDTNEVTTELQKAIDRAAKGARDPEAMRQASDRMDAAREALRRKVGDLDFAVPTIRELRDGK